MKHRSDLGEMFSQVCAAMRTYNVAQASTEYHGSGDSGEIYDTTLSPVCDAKIEVQGRPVSLVDAAAALCEEAIDHCHNGYMNDNGGGGTITCHAQGLMEIDAYDEVLRPTHTSTRVKGVREKNNEEQAAPSSQSECNAVNIRRITDAMESAGIKSISVQYSGGGDSGSIDDVTISKDAPPGLHLDVWQEKVIYDQESRQWNYTWYLGSQSLIDAARNTAGSLIESHHDGYENNDGGEGSVIFCPKKHTALIEHKDFNGDREDFYLLLIDPGLNELQSIEIIQGHRLRAELIHPLTPAQIQLKNRLLTEDIKDLATEYRALFNGSSPPSPEADADDHPADEDGDSPKS